MAKKDFYNFDEALKKLRLKEEELKRLVSVGEIPAFRDGEGIAFRKEDVIDLLVELEGVSLDIDPLTDDDDEFEEELDSLLDELVSPSDDWQEYKEEKEEEEYLSPIDISNAIIMASCAIASGLCSTLFFTIVWLLMFIGVLVLTERGE